MKMKINKLDVAFVAIAVVITILVGYVIVQSAREEMNRDNVVGKWDVWSVTKIGENRWSVTIMGGEVGFTLTYEGTLPSNWHGWWAIRYTLRDGGKLYEFINPTEGPSLWSWPLSGIVIMFGIVFGIVFVVGVVMRVPSWLKKWRRRKR